MPLTVTSVVNWWARISGDRAALVFEGQALDYRGLDIWSAEAAAALTKLGVVKGDRVGILGQNSIEWCVAALAAIRCGALMVPLNYRYTASELASVLGDCAPRLVLADLDQTAKLAEANEATRVEQLIATMQSARGGAPAPAVAADPDDEIAIIYTSGSTAAPKGVVHSHRSRLAYAHESLLIDPCWGPGRKALGLAPLYTGAGTVTFLQFIALGMTMYFSTRFDGDEAFRTLVDARLDLISGVPTFFERIAAAPGFNEADLSHVGFASTGGSRVSRALMDAWGARGVVLRQLYGLTEGGGAVTTMPADGAILHPEKCGQGGPFTKMKVVDTKGDVCPAGAPGEIMLRGPIMMTRYWNNPEATEQAYQNGWLRTGDLGVMDSDGNLTMIDRIKDIIISGGLNISPIDIEAVISAFPGIEEVSVFGVDDKTFGETPMAVLYSQSEIQIDAVIAHCNARLADYKVPRYVVVAEAPLPRLATGKIAKRALKAIYADQVETLPRVR